MKKLIVEVAIAVGTAALVKISKMIMEAQEETTLS